MGQGDQGCRYQAGLKCSAIAQPEAYLGGADKLFDGSGKLANDGTCTFLRDLMQAHAQ